MFIKNILILSIALFGCGEDNRVINTAHRGASGKAPENTMIAIMTAIKAGSDFSELDVQETKDGVLVLLHDGNLKRTTGLDRNIWEMPYDSIVGLDAGSWFSSEFKDEPIPTLESVIDAVNGKMKLNIELKMNGHEKQLAERVVALVEDKGFISNCILTSFDFEIINKVKQLNGNIKVGYIFKKIPQNVDVFNANVDLLSVNKKLVDEEFVKKAHAGNKEVHVWTVNESEEMKRLIDLGVNSIITNRPDVLVDLLRYR
jgi:glycerophosphoryl diester phosphodiesterase